VTARRRTTSGRRRTAEAAPGEVLLDLDWDTGDTSQWTAPSAHEAGSGAAHQFTLSNTVRRRPSGWAARFEMHNSSTDIASNAGFRSLWAKYDTAEGTSGGTDFAYGFSVRFPVEGTQTAKPSTGIMLWELHQRANIYGISGSLAIAPHAVMLRDGEIQYRMMTGAGNWTGSAWTGYSAYYDQIQLRPASSVLVDRWYDVIVHLVLSETSSGLAEVWVRDAAEAWTTSPQWSVSAPTMPYVPGGLDPAVPTKRSVTDVLDGYSGMYLETGLYTGTSTWSNSQSQIITYMDELRKYSTVAAAKAGFPA
jgi:hypothetical protein